MTADGTDDDDAAGLVEAEAAALGIEAAWRRRVDTITRSLCALREAQAGYDAPLDGVDDRAYGATERAGLAALRQLYRFGGRWQGGAEEA